MTAKSQDDARVHPRVRVSLKIEYSCAREFFEDYVKNLSLGGMFVESEKQVSIGMPVLFKFYIPELEGAIEGRGKVARLQQKSADGEIPAGFGVQFELFEEKSEKRLREYVGTNAKSRAGRRPKK